jgi:Rod binding domain-containing protein
MSYIEIGQLSATRPNAPDDEPENKELSAAAKRFEATFLYEMLKATELGQSRDGFGGGIGEDQFSTFLLQKHADAIAEAGGIGLAPSIYQSLLERSE